MEKVPFSPLGFKQLETQLHALTDLALQAEADAVLADYIDWVDKHVILTIAQIEYLESLHPIFIESLSANAAVAFITRLPLNLVLPEDYANASARDRKGKWFLDKSRIVPSSSPGQALEASGELIYEFEYEDEQ